jgi:hypothetical protein
MGVAEIDGPRQSGRRHCRPLGESPVCRLIEIKLNGVEGELGYIKYEEVEGKLKIAVGLDLKPYPPHNPAFAEYECTGSTEKGHLEGSVIGKITPINMMTTTQNLLYFATKAGEQRPEYFQGSPQIP